MKAKNTVADKFKSNEEKLKAEVEVLTAKLEEANETLRAIQAGEIDALVVNGKEGHKIFTLESADHPYRIMVETMSEGAATITQDGIIYYCNQRFANMIRQPLESLIGTSIFTYIPKNSQGLFKAIVLEGIKGRSERTLNFDLAPDTSIPVHLSMSAVALDDKPGVCLIATDLTEQKSHEEAKADLERLNIEKELREKFVSMLSHDLRNPLTAARVSAQLIVRLPCEAEKHKLLGEKIIGNIDRADKMIRDLLDANLIRAGEKLSLEISEFDLVQVVQETLDDLATVHGDRFLIKSSSQLVGYWSATQLRRVLENLASNAIKYGSNSKPVTVSLKDLGDKVQLNVHNFGRPLSPEEQLDIFKPFARGQTALNGGEVGWGLGLTLVKGVIEGHGGNVFVTSSKETGTNFIVELPKDSRPFQQLS